MRLDHPDKHGVTKRQHYAQAGKHLPPIEIDSDCGHVWRWFIMLSAQRGSGAFGPCPISIRDIQAFSSVFGVAVLPWEARAILEMDVAYLAELNKANSKNG